MGQVKNVALGAVLLLSVSACGARNELALGSVHTSVPATAPSSPVTDKVYEPTSAAPMPAICPDSGVRYGAGVVDAALGHRGVVITLENCGAMPQKITGYPAVKVLGGAGQELGVTVEHGTSYLAIDPGPKTVMLGTGETLLSVVAWSATVTDGDITTGAGLSIASVPGELPQKLTVRTDLGTTGKIQVTAWARKLAQ